MFHQAAHLSRVNVNILNRKLVSIVETLAIVSIMLLALMIHLLTALSSFQGLRRYSEVVAKWKVLLIRRGDASKLDDVCSRTRLRAFEGSVRIPRYVCSNYCIEYPHMISRRRVYERPFSPAAHSTGHGCRYNGSQSLCYKVP
jgi:hypothetical protein